MSKHDEAFLETLLENLQQFDLKLLPKVITFCDQTLSKANEEVKKAKLELDEKNDINEVKEIKSELKKNAELNKEHLKKIRRKK